MAQHPDLVRASVVLGMIGCFCALALAVSSWALTRDQDGDLAAFVMAFRIAEGVTGAAASYSTLGLLALATASPSRAPDPAAAQAIGHFVLSQNFDIGATFFAIGSTIFAWLLLRGRIVPAWLATIGLAGSALLVVGLPLNIMKLLPGSVAALMWIPVAVFEIVVAFWFLIKGAAEPIGNRSLGT